MTVTRQLGRKESHSKRRLEISFMVVLAALLLAGLICGGGAIALHTVKPTVTPMGTLSTAVVTVVAAPTNTPLPIPELMFTSTPTVAPVAGDGIGIGMYVQILGTGGDGLRLRSGAGMSYDPIFLGMEAEVFEVMDGPREGDGFMWWFLKAPYDPNRKGWARSDYLSVVSTSQNP